MITFLDTPQDDILAIRATGRVTHADYQEMQRKISVKLREHDKLRMLLDLENFHGWDVRAAWDELKMGAEGHGHFERCAIVGDRWWEEGLTTFSKLFWKVEYFDRSQRDKAWQWLSRPANEADRALAPAAWESLAEVVRSHPLLTAGLALGVGLLVANFARE
jgi:hypothetical protein